MFEKGAEDMNAQTSVSLMVVASVFCLTGTVTSPAAVAADAVVMHAGSGSFAPLVTMIEVGERVTWVNDSLTDDVFVTAARPVVRQSAAGTANLEMNAVLRPRTTYTHAFKEPGTYYYYCAGHMDMWGLVIVKEVLLAR
jgi:plastocyanin